MHCQYRSDVSNLPPGPCTGTASSKLVSSAGRRTRRIKSTLLGRIGRKVYIPLIQHITWMSQKQRRVHSLSMHNVRDPGDNGGVVNDGSSALLTSSDSSKILSARSIGWKMCREQRAMTKPPSLVKEVERKWAIVRPGCSSRASELPCLFSSVVFYVLLGRLHTSFLVRLRGSWLSIKAPCTPVQDAAWSLYPKNNGGES